MSRVRPKSVWILIIVFACSAGKTVEVLVRGGGSADYQLFHYFGLAWIVVLTLLALLPLQLAALWYLFRPAPAGLTICKAGIALSAIETTVALLIALKYPWVAGDAYRISLSSRGRAYTPDMIQMAQNPTLSFIAIVITWSVAALWLSLVDRNHGYFAGNSKAEAK